VRTIQIVLDARLLREVDRAAQRTKLNRSALIRDALREHLLKLETRAQEERDRAGYAKEPRARDESLLREREAAWPAE
jgi:metal-responsive CopG/Arc/MetJ family transcriptional regulator